MASIESDAIKAIDFISRHSISSSSPIRQRTTEVFGTYKLRQTSPDTKILESTSEPGSWIYTITSHPTGGFLNRHPHMLFTKHEKGLNTRFAEVRFEINGYGTTITYKDGDTTQALVLEDPREQRYQCKIEGTSHWWQPLGPSKSVLELTEETGVRVALFVYAEETPQRRASAPATLKDFETEEIGEIYIMDSFVGDAMALEHILCTAVVLVERAKRRAANPGLASWGSVSSKKHYLGRRDSHPNHAASPQTS